MNRIILHHYPQSPVAEKVRVGLGIKGLAWTSVEIPRIPPKPLLMPLTGGYRRTPVMQVGADIYCDSQCILREIERREPLPSFYPGGANGMAWGVSRWTDGELFELIIKLVLGAAGDALPPDFAEDRGRLYLGADWRDGLKRVEADLPHIASQVRAEFGWMDQRLATGRRFMLGDAPGLPDALTYYLVWFLRGRWSGGPEFLSEFPALETWETRVRAIGHGTVSEMNAEAALVVAQAAEPATAEQTDPRDPQGLAPGMAVTIALDLDGGEEAVTGRVHAVSRETIAILRQDARVGRVCVHFPRAGYRVDRRPH
jgi:glutathione S-transferase